MANLSHSESRRKYSWWWDSHNTPKNSKWLQDNLTDIDGKVKSMIKLIEEDADSFARRAEMYYKKRPELMKLVEEFYRAYRALAERYNHATGELRHAQQTIAKAFPDEVPFDLVEELKLPAHALFNADDNLLENSARGVSSSEADPRKKGLKQLPEMFGSEKTGARSQNHEDESEAQCLKKALDDMKAEKENVLTQYQQCLERLSEIEHELNNAQNDSTRLGEKASRAEIEVQTLKEALIQFEVEKIAGMIKQNDYLEKISRLEAMVSRFQEEMKGLDGRACEAESEAQNLKDEISKLEFEKETVVCQYMQSLEKISDLEKIISKNENEAKFLKKQAEIAENEVFELKRAFADLNKEKEEMALEYKCCLEKISELENDLSMAKHDVERLNNEVLTGNSKLRTVEDKFALMETSNRSLRAEADNLAKKIAVKDRELVKKQEDLEKLENCLQDEHSRRAQVEAALESLQNLNSQSQDDRRALKLELDNVVKMLNDVEISKNGLEKEIQEVKETNLSSSVSMENMRNEIDSLREIKKRLENEVSRHADITVSLQKEILCLKEEIEGLNKSYRGLVEQVEAAGLNPKCIETSIKSLSDENLNLRQKCEQENIEKAVLSKKLEEIEEALEKKVIVESSLSGLNADLAASHGEKAALVAEKASILSQLHAMTENMQNLLGKNAVLEDSLSAAKIELQGLREKSKGLGEICELLKNERAFLLTERCTLVSKLENVEKRLNSLEKQFTGLEIKYADLEKEKQAMHFQVEKLQVSLSDEKREREDSQIESETRLAGLENWIHLLQEENKWKKKESEEEIDKSLKAQFEITVLHKFIKDMEEKNCALIMECQKHVEASRLAEKVISELEGESLEQQVEAELLLDEIERLRLGIYQIFRGLESGSDFGSNDNNKVENEQTFVNQILGSIEDLKCCVSKNEDEKQQLLVENSVLLALLEELELKGIEIESKKINIERESKIMAERLVFVENEKDELLEINGQLKSDANKGHLEAAVLETELESLCVRQRDLQKAYNTLQEAYSRVNEENTHLLKKFSELKEEKFEVDRHNDAILHEFLANSNEVAVLRSFGMEKITELKLILEDLSRQHDISASLEKEMIVLREKLDLQKADNLVLKDAILRLEREMQETRECNEQMNKEILNGKESLNHTEAKLLGMKMKLEAVEKSNSNLRGTVFELETNLHESLKIRENLENSVFELSENNSTQKKEIESLCVVNKNLEFELFVLRREMEENTAREQSLSTELQEMNNEFELWEAEASTFCFDLQVSSIHEVLLKNKVQELTGVCQSLEHKHDAKVSEIEGMKEKIRSMENEVCGLKSQLHAYAPVVASLRDDIEILEHNALLHKKLKEAYSQETEISEFAARPSKESCEDQSLLSLRSLQTRVKAVGKLIEETNKPVLQRRSNSDSIQEFETDRSKPRRSFSRKKGHTNDELNDSPKLQRSKAKSSEARNGTLMKDIPLDQVSNNSSRRRMQKKGKVGGSDDLMLELWETAEDGNHDRTIGESLEYNNNNNSIVKVKSLLPLTDSDVERELAVDKLELSMRKPEPNDTKILEKLALDAEKLVFLQTTLGSLRKKLEMEKKSRKVKNVDFEAVREQLQEAEDTVVHLVDLNCQLVKNIEYCPKDEMDETVRMWRIKVVEQAEKGSEKIERLQLGLQKIQYFLLKMEDEKKNKGKNKFLRSKTIILRDFIDNGRKNSGRRKKGPRCGCFRQSTSRNANTS
ncbi:hypothetical protein PHJA_002677400 [Phtheirospermum japonicum]|uniref:NAB domain-containing protein n=1 Tax=Phtheirospermum japonicum TaxID=374723 RepID=A0A830D3Y2_9LAMI|nr:hypothetical protein PHJA_002677400 [Phtheirospermum japonicum]